MKKHILFIVLAAFYFVSCEDILTKEIPLEDFNYEEQISFSGHIDADTSVLDLLVTKNQSITDPDFLIKSLDNAEVNLFKDGVLLGALEQQEENYTYESPDDNFSPGNYTVEVSHPDFENKAISQTNIPEHIPLTEVTYLEDFGIALEFGERSDALRFKFKDPEGDNYYNLKISSDIMFMDTFFQGVDTFIYENFVYLDFATNDPNVIYDYQQGFIMNDATFNNQNYVLDIFFMDYNDFPIEDLLQNIKVEWSTISKDRFQFINSYRLYQESSDFGPFGEIVTLHNNIENGLGIFAGQNTVVYQIE